MKTEIVLRNIAGAAAHFVNLGVGADDDSDTRADGAPIRNGTDTLDLDPVPARSPVVAKQSWKIVDVAHHDVDIAVVVEITECTPAG